MKHLDIPGVLAETGLAFIVLLIFIGAGHIICRLVSTNHRHASLSHGVIFKEFLAGLIAVITCYALVVAKGCTILFLLAPLLLLWLRTDSPNTSTRLKPQTKFHPWKMLLEVLFIVFTTVLILHLFPESEYKQADSYFYLKIAESLNLAGQENISHYYNIYSADFHGTEPYHYFDIWLISFVIRFTEGFYSSILISRFVVQAVLISGIVLALYHLAEVVFEGRLSLVQKLFCWSLIFFLPNILNFFPQLYYVFISDFEGNLLERPNHRVVYLVMVPVVTAIYSDRKVSERVLYLLLFGAVFSFILTIVVFPALCLYALLGFLRKQSYWRRWSIILVSFLLLFAGFYLFFPPEQLPSVFQNGNSDFITRTIHGFKFILFSLVGSLIYLALLAVLFAAPFLISFQNALSWVKSYLNKYWLIYLMALIGVVFARVLYQKDNAYQFIFISDIIVSLLVWFFILLVSKKRRSKWILPTASLMMFSTFMLHVIAQPELFFVDTYRQNGNNIYGGKKYSEAYLKEVDKFFEHHPNIVGAYMGDTAFYRSLHYSRRNPNVYSLPATYINAVSRNRQFEFCLSDPADIMVDISYPLELDYLRNALDRSYFTVYAAKHSGLARPELVRQFITDNRISYLYLTAGVEVDPWLSGIIKNQWVDPVTGERFVALVP